MRKCVRAISAGDFATERTEITEKLLLRNCDPVLFVPRNLSANKLFGPCVLCGSALVARVFIAKFAFMELIKKELTLEYWPEHGWFEGRLREIPEMLSQGQSLDELEENVREDCAELLSDEEYARERGYAHLDPADVRNADLKHVELNRFQAACAQLQALSPDRAEKVYAYIEDLIDLEALERKADADEAARRNEETGEEEW